MRCFILRSLALSWSHPIPNPRLHCTYPTTAAIAHGTNLNYRSNLGPSAHDASRPQGVLDKNGNPLKPGNVYVINHAPRISNPVSLITIQQISRNLTARYSLVTRPGTYVVYIGPVSCSTKLVFSLVLRKGKGEGTWKAGGYFDGREVTFCLSAKETI